MLSLKTDLKQQQQHTQESISKRSRVSMIDALHPTTTTLLNSSSLIAPWSTNHNMKNYENSPG